MVLWCCGDVIKCRRIPKYLNYFIINIKWVDLHEFQIGMRMSKSKFMRFEFDGLDFDGELMLLSKVFSDCLFV